MVVLLLRSSGVITGWLCVSRVRPTVLKLYRVVQIDCSRNQNHTEGKREGERASEDNITCDTTEHRSPRQTLIAQCKNG